MKFQLGGINSGSRGSHPARGAWIEIAKADALLKLYDRRTPHGVRGLK